MKKFNRGAIAPVVLAALVLTACGSTPDAQPLNVPGVTGTATEATVSTAPVEIFEIGRYSFDQERTIDIVYVERISSGGSDLWHLCRKSSTRYISQSASPVATPHCARISEDEASRLLAD